MPAGGFKTFSAGSVLTASDVNAYLMQGVLVFTNEAARDAAITSPVEGMVAYLTAPTVPAATGATTVVPTGIRTIYNGSTWVCVTPVAAYTSATGTTSSTSFTATLAGTPGTNPSVTLTTGTTARIIMSAELLNNVASNGFMSVAVSGATTLNANTDYCVQSTNTTSLSLTQVVFLTGLTAGSNTFTLQYSNASGQTLTAAKRRICVEGVA